MHALITPMILLIAALILSPTAGNTATIGENTERAVTFIQQRCVTCHGGDETNAGIDLSPFSSELDVWEKRRKWNKILRVLEHKRMPPEESTPLDNPTRDFLIQWIRNTLTHVDITRIPRDPGFIPMKRLNRHEYHYTVQDLFGMSITPASSLPIDLVHDDGFDNDAAVLTLESLWFEKALTASDTVIRSVWKDPGALSQLLFIKPTEPETGRNKSRVRNRLRKIWAALKEAVKTGELSEKEAKNKITDLIRDFRERNRGRKKIKRSDEEHTVSEEQAASRILKRFLSRAFRRAATRAELTRYQNLYQTAAESGRPFELALQIPVKAALVSPRFLLRSETAKQLPDPYPVSSMEMASRLSYFLWASMPDDKLLEAGNQGTLSQLQSLTGQVDRMLSDQKAKRFFERFTLQWLRIEGLGNTILPDKDQFPSVTLSLMDAMKSESVLVFGDVLRSNRSLLNLLESDSTFMNAELAEHYGYREVKGHHWRKVPLRDSTRGGLLTHASVLTVSSSPRRTSPVFRGKWILDVLLGEPPQPPPPNIPALSVETGQASGNLRAVLENHRRDSACARCHNQIDPLGFALEQYDAVGRLRPEKQNTTAKLPTGESITGVPDLRQLLLKQKKDTYIRHLTEKLLSYALGRRLRFADQRPLETILSQLKKNNYKAHTLIREIIGSDPFRNRKNPSVQDLSR